ncbi:MAG: RsmD family RNA methyltransferase, partial [Bacteroidales bacterium]|nr:RsmD family RNA methyltransferase [Bacteroidales bacterium]
GLGEVVTVVHHNVFDFLPLCKKRFDLIFADPPYALEGLAEIPDKIMNAGLLHPDCYFILEHPADYSFTEHPHFFKERKYGNVHFSFFR